MNRRTEPPLRPQTTGEALVEALVDAGAPTGATTVAGGAR